MAAPPPIEAFIQYVGEVHARNFLLRERLLQMEQFYRQKEFTENTDITDVAAEMFRLLDVTAIDFVQWYGFHVLTLRLNPASPADDAEHLRSDRNEIVRLNARFFNSLAVWFAGAGAAGALFNTLMTPTRNFAGAGEIGAVGVVIALVLKWLASREIRKLK